MSTPTGGTRPKGLHIKHLTELERFRVRTLYYDAGMSKPRIKQVTGYSTSQIRTAIHAKTAAVAPRSGRPKRDPNGETPTKKSTDKAGSSSQDPAEGELAVSPSGHINYTPNTPSLPNTSLQPPQGTSQQQPLPSFTTSQQTPSFSTTQSIPFS
ncbi:hypothetical protein F4805DRAFT_458954 [Annulohypoxylon moriforme]|nr:hypothetical protein F4805DRAFT_458954 [Annulohypoxylon moriforme]